uniref:SAM domain-containing protein n=1 Tax=Nothoprocta perdicaria TaxID=30464 RepID=A0A8C6Z7P0_NOTPE
MMWYGVLGTKELLQRTYKNLEQRVQLECDGVPISLPSLQGIAVLNIPSYAGGINFWGGTKEDNNFGAPSFDDKKLEVVAVFGSIQMAVSRVINLQHHRIAQCRMVKITIRGDEGVPVQVDGEAWIQPPGVIKIQHKNRAQMLTRDRVSFASSLSMEEGTPRSSRQPRAVCPARPCRSRRIHEAAKAHRAMEQELAHAVNTSSLALSEALSSRAAGSPEVSAAAGLGRPPGARSRAQPSRRRLGLEGAARCCLPGLGPPRATAGTRALLRSGLSSLPADKWSSEEVAAWLETLGLGEYRDIFVRHDIQGSELILLERRDLKDLGITKVGHMKRILQAIKELSSMRGSTAREDQ